MVAFASGVENLHGIKPLTAGSRYSLGMWFTEDPDHFEYAACEECKRILTESLKNELVRLEL